MIELAGGFDGHPRLNVDGSEQIDMVDIESIADDTEDDNEEESDGEPLFVKNNKCRAIADKTKRKSGTETEEESVATEDDTVESEDDDGDSDDDGYSSPDEEDYDDIDEAFTQGFADGNEELAATQLRQMPITDFMTRGYNG
jgi:hypothetical protein